MVDAADCIVVRPCSGLRHVDNLLCRSSEGGEGMATYLYCFSFPGLHCQLRPLPIVSSCRSSLQDSSLLHEALTQDVVVVSTVSGLSLSVNCSTPQQLRLVVPLTTPLRGNVVALPF